MGSVLSRYWWATLFRGVFWIAFAIFALSHPRLSILSLTLALSIVLLADGAVNVVSAVRGRKENDDWWIQLLGGLCGIGIGLITIYNPAITALAAVLYVAIWAVSTGVLEIVGAVRLRKEIRGEFWLALAGVASVVFGVLLALNPGAGAVTLLWLMSIFAIAFGAMLMLLAFRVRRVARHVEGMAHA
jgi:uncharacterized membrane protein HdeD (DUF308 family)